MWSKNSNAILLWEQLIFRSRCLIKKNWLWPSMYLLFHECLKHTFYIKPILQVALTNNLYCITACTWFKRTPEHSFESTRSTFNSHVKRHSGEALLPCTTTRWSGSIDWFVLMWNRNWFRVVVRIVSKHLFSRMLRATSPKQCIEAFHAIKDKSSPKHLSEFIWEKW